MLKRALSDSWNFFRNHFTALSALILPFAIPFEITSAALNWLTIETPMYYQAQITIIVGYLLLKIFLLASVIYFIFATVQGKKTTITRCWRAGVVAWWPTFCCSLVFSVITSIGFLLFVIPAIILGALSVFSFFEVTIYREKIWPALKQSWRYAWPALPTLVLGSLLIYACLNIPLFLVSELLDDSSIGGWVFFYGSNMVYWVLDFFLIVFAYRVYEWCRGTQRNELADDSKSE